MYPVFQYGVIVLLSGSTIVDNDAACTTCFGGGLYLGPGGNLTVTNTSILGNKVGQFGGGCFLGVLATSSSSSTCAAAFHSGSVLAGNVGSHGGAQLYSTCNGPLDFADSDVRMTTDASQVYVLGEWGRTL